MGLFTWLFQWFGGADRAAPKQPRTAPTTPVPDSSPPSNVPASAPAPATNQAATATETHRPRLPRGPRVKPRLTPSRLASQRRHRLRPASLEVTGGSPYRFARFGSRTDCYLDLSQDGDEERLRAAGMPVLKTPEQIADWLGIPLHRLAWLVHRFSNGVASTVAKSHYHYTWVKKRSGDLRLIESPKKELKKAQGQILREILDQARPHAAAHGFVPGRSILTNARPHAGQGIVLKFDLANFYPTVGFSRVVAIFRKLGYSREASIWLGQLTTSTVPYSIPFDRATLPVVSRYFRRHLPQGAPTSPALANLSAFWLDVRLAGLARSYGATYTRYADDLTVSGPADLSGGLRSLIPLVEAVIRKERFQSNVKKRQVLRSHQRQSVAGVVVNERPNVSRATYDRLKATLTNCIRQGPSTQNRDQAEDYAAHLRGRIAHVQQLNPARGQRLLALYGQIDWSR